MLGSKNQNGGFTLIEVMIVVAIIAIGSTLAVPAYLQWNARYELRQAIVELASQLTMARMSARNRNMAVVSTLTLTGSTVTMTTTNTAGTVTIFPSVTFPATITDVRDAATPDGALIPAPVTIAFTSLGLQGPTTSPLPLRIKNNTGLAYSVVVTPAGKVNWCTKATCP